MTLRGAAGDFPIGVALTDIHFGDAAYTRTAALNYNSMVAENECKWSAIQGQRGTFNFDKCDGLLDFAEANDMEFRFHVLAWGDYNPNWVNFQLPEEDKRETFVNHIRTVAQRYCGRVSAFDVVNEAITEEGGMKEHAWYPSLPDYIELAHRTAREACPEAKLFYNDYNIASSRGWSQTKSDAVYALAQDLQSKGLIDGVGLQAHLSLDYENGNSVDGIRENMARIGALGLEVQITEIDIACRTYPYGDCSDWDAAKEDRQAALYRDTLNACLEEPACTSYTMWGFSDRYTWITSLAGGIEQFPLPFDATTQDGLYQPKPAFFALVDELESHKNATSAA